MRKILLGLAVFFGTDIVLAFGATFAFQHRNLFAWITPDMVNSAFEAAASLFILNHCRVLWASGQAHGVSLLSSLFFWAWGGWNVFYYPHLGQLFSFYAGIAVLAANSFWCWSIWYIRRHDGTYFPNGPR